MRVVVERSLVLCTVFLAACSSLGAASVGTSGPGSPALVFEERFDEVKGAGGEWTATVPGVRGAMVQHEGSSLKLVMPASKKGEIVARRQVDVSRLRGKRVRLSVRIRTEAAEADADAALAVTPGQGRASYGDRTAARSGGSTSWRWSANVLDVAADAVSAELLLTLREAGTVWFDDVEIAVVGGVPARGAVQLSAVQRESVMTLARVIALVRFLHPADETAELDWDRFIPTAIERILRARDPAGMRELLQELFKPVAPTVAFVPAADRAPGHVMEKGAGSHLARWHRYGFEGLPYGKYREGRDAEGEAWVDKSVDVKLVPGCRKVRADAKVRERSGRSVQLYFQLLGPGRARKTFSQSIPIGDGEVTVAGDVPAGAEGLEVAIRLTGRSAVTIERLTVSCDAGSPTVVDLAGPWDGSGWRDLYNWTVTRCGDEPCVKGEHRPLATEFVAERDLVDREIGSGLRIRMPMAVWTDGQRTLPAAVGQPVSSDLTINDAPVRLGMIVAAWSMFKMFYPYFKDQQIDWDATLPAALDEAARASNPEETRAALAHLLAHTADGHIRVIHPSRPTTGTWPFELRRFGDKLIVVAGVAEYLRDQPRGTEVVAIDGVPALELYERTHDEVAGAVAGWRAFYTAAALTMGEPGTFQRVRFRSAEGKESERLVPLLSREIYDDEVRGPLPKSGSEVAPGIVYVDFGTITEESWKGVMAPLQQAKAIILDLRGYVSSGSLGALTSFSERALVSPEFQIPMVNANGTEDLVKVHWTIWPTRPYLAVPVVVLVDGRAGSAVETALQIIRENRLATLVGEPSAGFNGNVFYFNVPGGFTVRGTGMRVAGPTGETIHGRGFVPDQLVSPTVEGVRAGRDEILEAGIAAAQRLAKP